MSSFETGAKCKKNSDCATNICQMKYRDGEYRDDAAIDVTGVARRDASAPGAAATWS